MWEHTQLELRVICSGPPGKQHYFIKWVGSDRKVKTDKLPKEVSSEDIQAAYDLSRADADAMVAAIHSHGAPAAPCASCFSLRVILKCAYCFGLTCALLTVRLWCRL